MESKEDKLSVPDLPETFEGRYNQLRNLVNEAVTSLLKEVKKRDALSKKNADKPAYLTPPYGRMAPPTPLMTRDEFLALKEKGIPEYDMKIEDIPDPSFEFKYGFNPLTYISDYLKWWHPTSAEQRKQNREDSVMDLHKTALLAKQKCGQLTEQAMRATVASSGIVYGPLVSPISETSVRIVALALQTKGHIILELSCTADYAVIDRVMECEVDTKGTATCRVEDLIPASQYYVRASFCSDGVLAKQKSEALRLQQEAEGTATGASKKKSKKSKKVDEESTNENTDATDPADTVEEVVGADVMKLPDEVNYTVYRDSFGEEIALPCVFNGVEGGLFQATSFTTLPSLDSIEETFTPSQSRPGTAPSTPGVSRVGTPMVGIQADRFGGGQSILRNSVTLVAESRQPRSKEPEVPSETMCFAGTGEVPDHIISAVNSNYSSSECSVDTKNDKEILINCVLGDFFEEAKADAVKFFSSGCSSTLTSSSILHRASTIYAWNDTTSGAFMDLMAEELVYKEYQHSLKKYKKKYESNDTKAKEKRKKEKDNSKDKTPPPPPILNRPEPSAKYAALTQLFPVPSVEEGATRHTYRMLNIGRFVQVFVLDMREGMLGKAQSKWLIEMLEGSNAAWKIVLAGKPLGLVQKSRGETDIAEKRSGPTSLVSDEIDAKVTDAAVDTNTDQGLIATNATIKAQEETMAAVSSSSLPFVFTSVMQTYMSSPDTSPVNSRPTSKQQNYSTLPTTVLDQTEDFHGGRDVTDVEYETAGPSVVASSIEESLVIDIEKEMKENAAPDLSANTDIDGKIVNFAPLPVNENSSSSASLIKNLSVSSGIIFVTGGTPFPFLASYGSESKGHCQGECFAVEVGTGNSLWPATIKSNEDSFEADSSLNPKFMFGGFNGNEGNTEGQVTTSSRVVLKINAASEDGISIKVLNTADLGNGISEKNENEDVESSSANMAPEGGDGVQIASESEGSADGQNEGVNGGDNNVKPIDAMANDISVTQVMYEINLKLI